MLSGEKGGPRDREGMEERSRKESGEDGRKCEGGIREGMARRTGCRVRWDTGAGRKSRKVRGGSKKEGAEENGVATSFSCPARLKSKEAASWALSVTDCVLSELSVTDSPLSFPGSASCLLSIPA